MMGGGGGVFDEAVEANFSVYNPPEVCYSWSQTVTGYHTAQEGV
jgi:hypothetical protein